MDWERGKIERKRGGLRGKLLGPPGGPPAAPGVPKGGGGIPPRCEGSSVSESQSGTYPFYQGRIVPLTCFPTHPPLPQSSPIRRSLQTLNLTLHSLIRLMNYKVDNSPGNPKGGGIIPPGRASACPCPFPSVEVAPLLVPSLVLGPIGPTPWTSCSTGRIQHRVCALLTFCRVGGCDAVDYGLGFFVADFYRMGS